jgi:hypothetical protein
MAGAQHFKIAIEIFDNGFAGQERGAFKTVHGSLLSLNLAFWQ